ncbi:hypothetical protein AAG570_013633 [Ranatra chinensis]|uniref:Golgi apparatus membrane protein TVP23 homolog n=1 Tax=Ranatra chinensis TaxID=642074 RepID=A0ABD0YPE3_9HEMI
MLLLLLNLCSAFFFLIFNKCESCEFQAPLLEDDTVPFGEENHDQSRLKHPYVTICHVVFRAGAIFFYLFCNWFIDSFITSFVIVVLLLSMDFWTVKNITGRLMVGLRWWNYIDDDGVSHWVFESRKGNLQNRIHPSESRIFWLALFIAPAFWAIFFLVAILSFKFKWLLLVSIALALSGANLYGYLKCKFGQSGEGFSSSITSATSSFFRKQIIENVRWIFYSY